jgi:hypothetical protein
MVGAMGLGATRKARPAHTDGGIVVRSGILSLAIAVLFGGASAAAAEPAGVITILDGNAIAIRGLFKFALGEGVRVAGDDLVETGKGTFLRVEFADGTIVDLGPATRAQLNRPTLRRFDRPALYLLSGWMKLNAGKLAGARASFASPQFDVLGLAGETVASVEDRSSAVFAENGPVQLLNRRAGAKTPIALKSGDFAALRKDEAPKIEGRPTHEFVAAMPRQFQDPLPSRIAQFGSREVPARPIGPFTYAEVEAWVDAEPMIRRRFVREWVAKLNDWAFREKLDAGLARHPEWERVLYPERFEPKPTAPVASAPSLPAAGGSAPVNPSVPAATPATGGPDVVPGTAPSIPDSGGSVPVNPSVPATTPATGGPDDVPGH